MRRCYGIGSFLLFLSCFTGVAFGASFILAPPRVEMTVHTKSVQKVELTVITGPEKEQSYFAMYVVDFKVNEDGEISYAEPGSLERSASSWVKLDPARFQMGPNEKKKINLKLTIPGNTCGGYYAAIVLDPVPLSAIGKGNTVVHNVRMVSLVELKVLGSGRLREDAGISEIKAARGGQGQGLTFKVTVENKGDIHVRAEGNVVVRANHGGMIATVPLRAGRGFILPGTSRYFEAVLDRQIPAGDYVAEATLKYGLRGKAVASLPFSMSGGVPVATRAMVNESGIRFVVDPYLVDISARGGAFRTMAVLVQNEDSKSIHISVNALAMSFNPDGDLVISDSAGGQWSCANWVELKPTEFDLLPGERSRVMLRIRIPRDVVGGRCAHVGFKATKEGAQGGEVLEGSAGTVLLLTIPGNGFRIAGEVTDLQVSQAQRDNALNVVASFKNDGNVHVVPMGKVIIRPASVGNQGSTGPAGSDTDKIVGEFQFDEIVGAILPGATRRLASTIQQRFPAGEYIAEVVLSYGGQNAATMERKFIVR